jgi:hypothetical protein
MSRLETPDRHIDSREHQTTPALVRGFSYFLIEIMNPEEWIHFLHPNTDHPEAYQAVFERYDIRVALVSPPIDTGRTSHAKEFPVLAGLLTRFHLIPEEQAEGGNLANHLERDGWRQISVDEQSALYVLP